MTLRDKAALTIPPLFIRLALAAAFLYAGIAKQFGTIEVQGEGAAMLANMGVIKPAAASQTPAAPLPQTGEPKPAVKPAPAPTEPAPAPESQPKPGGAPESPLPEPTKPPTGGGAAKPSKGEPIAGVVRAVRVAFLEDDQPRVEKPHSLAGQPAPNASKPAAKAPAAPAEAPQPAHTTAAPSPAQSQQFTAADFPAPVKVKQSMGIAMLLVSSAHPTDGGKPRWPAAWSNGRWPVYFAHLAAWTELVCGALVLVGFLTRLAAFGLACVMLNAIWLTSIGPVVLGPSGTASLWGFLPPINNFEMGPWSTFLLQWALCMAALALVFSRAGWLSLDGLVFGRQPSEDDDEDEDDAEV